MNKQLVTISFLGALALTAHAAQDFYKWVDDKGVTHYSQSPPDAPSGKDKVQTINVRTKIPTDSAQAIADLEKKRAEAGKGKDDAAKKDKGGDAKTTAKNKELNKENCEQWKKDLELLQNKSRIMEDNGKGEVKALSEEEIKARLEKTQKYIKDLC
jgi:hypothetical protein